MKSVSSVNISDNSPKTPGGISKSLLTPCRRIGLSRTWRKSGPSPFISPVTSISSDIKEEKGETRKRKERLPEENNVEAPETGESSNNINVTITNDTYSEINVEVSCRKRSKNLLSSNSQEVIILPELVHDEEMIVEQKNNTTASRDLDVKKPETFLTAIDSSDGEITGVFRDRDVNAVNNDIIPTKPVDLQLNQPIFIQENVALETVKTRQRCFTEEILKKSQTDNSYENFELISKPPKTKSKNKNSISLKKIQIESKLNLKNKVNEYNKDCLINEQNEVVYTINDNSPNDLKKECIVVLQRKLFKNVENCITQPKTCNSGDDEPLINLQKLPSTKASLNKDNDTAQHIFHKDNLETKKSIKTKGQVRTSQHIVDEEDDDFDNKKTILIRKSYKKVSNPIKSKSTGSINQRDIEDLRNRIEAKKKLLLAQALTPDTEELRTLIKKWQKGCQDALMELLDLMKNKFPDTENMNYLEMLETLKIPPSLVGYDSTNDCFCCPDDASIILGKFKDF